MFRLTTVETSYSCSVLTTVDPLVYVQLQKQPKPFLYMFSVDYSRHSCLFSVLATVETCCICSVLTTVETYCLCSDLSTVEPFVYFQFNYSTCRSHMFMCSVNYSIHFYLFLVLTTVESPMCVQFNCNRTSCFCSVLSQKLFFNSPCQMQYELLTSLGVR